MNQLDGYIIIAWEFDGVSYRYTICQVRFLYQPVIVVEPLQIPLSLLETDADSAFTNVPNL